MDQIKLYFLPTYYIHDRQRDNEHEFVEMNILTVLKYADFVSTFRRIHLLRPLRNRVAFIL